MLGWLAIMAAPLSLFGLALWAYRRGMNSATEDTSAMSDSDATKQSDLPSNVLESLGWPYYFGKGSPSTPWTDGPSGVDCSGFVQMALVRLGKLSPTYGDRGSAALADDSDPIEVGQQEPGDIAYYPGHVMLVASKPDKSTGHSAVIGASGGTSTTLGTNPEARVKMFSSAKYRKDFVTYMRLKEGKR